jgi:hypothetical protein
MTIKVRVVAIDELVEASVAEPVDFERAKTILRRIAEAAGAMKDQRIMLDGRNLGSALTFGAMWYLAADLVRYASTFSGRTALLARPDRLEHMRFLALSAQNRGFAFRAFDDYAAAFDWLTEDPAAQEKPRVTH